VLRALLVAQGALQLGRGGVDKRALVSTPDIWPEGARFIECTYSSGGSRAYRLFIPSSLSGQPLPLVVMLTGLHQSPELSRLHEDELYRRRTNLPLWVYPAPPARQPGPPPPPPLKRWAEPGFAPPPSTLQKVNLRLSRASLAKSMRDYSVSKALFTFAGLSAGAAAAAIMGATYNDLYAAIGYIWPRLWGAPFQPSLRVCPLCREGVGSDACNLGDPPPGGPPVSDHCFSRDRALTVHPNNGIKCLAVYETHDHAKERSSRAGTWRHPYIPARSNTNAMGAHNL